MKSLALVLALMLVGCATKHHVTYVSQETHEVGYVDDGSLVWRDVGSDEEPEVLRKRRRDERVSNGMLTIEVSSMLYLIFVLVGM